MPLAKPNNITQSIFTNKKVSRICNTAILVKMHKALLQKPDALISEVTDLTAAIHFARKWHSGDEGVFFTFEETAKHCNTVLAIRARHFPFLPSAK